MDLEEKLDALLTGKATSESHQQYVSEILKEIRLELKELSQKESQQDTSIAVLQDNVNGIGKKLTNHINSHWKWIGMVLGIIGIVSGLITLLKR